MSEPTGSGWAAPDPIAAAPAGPVPVPPPPPPPDGAAPGGDDGWTPQPGWGAQPGPGAPSGWGPQPDHPAQPGWGAQPDPRAHSGWGAQPGWGAQRPPSPQPGVVPLRPLGLGEMLDGAVGLVRGYPRAALGVSVVVALAATLVQVALLFTVLAPLFDVDTTALQSGDTDALVGLLAGAGSALTVTVVFSTVSSALMTGFLSAIAGRAVLGQPMGLGELWATTRAKVPRLVGCSLLVGLAVYGPPAVAGLVVAALVAVAGGGGGAVGVLLLLASLVLSFQLYVRLSLATSVIVLEDAGVLASFRRSWLLARRAFWRVLGVLVLTFVISSFVAQVLQLPFALLGGDDGPLAALQGGQASSLSTRALLLSAVGSGVAGAVVSPFVAGVRALLYVDRRMRAEGLDVALQAAAATRA